MRKLMILAFLCVATAMNAKTETAEKQTNITGNTLRVHHIEFEIHYGVSAPLNHISYGDKSGGLVYGIELRYNFKNSPIDVGLVLDVSSAFYDHISSEYSDMVCDPGMEELNYETRMIGVTCDYNFRQGRNVNPFVGIGLGYGSHSVLYDAMWDNSSEDPGTAMITPRVGVELWRHLRLTLTANLSRKPYNNVSFTVGCVFGGGKKKN